MLLNIFQILLNEIGSPSDVEKAIQLFKAGKEQLGGGWEGRVMKIESLESTVASLGSELSQGSGRENSAEKMLNSRVNTPDETRGSGDGSSLSGNSPRFGRNSLEVIELETLVKVSEVECARLTELVQVLEKNLSTANERTCNVELNLRQERSKCATLQTLLEKAHLDLRQLSTHPTTAPKGPLTMTRSLQRMSNPQEQSQGSGTATRCAKRRHQRVE